MVVCKFFQQGYCRYGKNCRFEHIYGSKYTYHANPQTQPAQSAQAPNQPGVVTDEQLVKQVLSDVEAVLGGGQWILSCYAPFKEKPIFPGILDLSPEEARLFIYEAKHTNNLELAVTHMNNLYKEARLKYEQLLQPNVNIIKVLRSLYKGEIAATPFSNTPQNAFSNSNNAASSIFRSAVQSAPVLNPNANTAQSIFSQAQNNIFNTQQAPDPAKQLFSQANNTNVFGPSQPPASNIFATQTQNTAAKSIFASAVQNINTNSQNVPSNIFARANENSFQNVSSTPSSVFGQPFSTQQIEDDPGVYSKMEDLNDEDIEAFKGDSFQLGFIPELPPPRELCAAPRTQYFN